MLAQKTNRFFTKMKDKNLQKKFEFVIKRITIKLATEYKPEKIILYDSLANGNPRENIDIDMLIIKDLKTKNYSDRWIEVRRLTRELTEGISFKPILVRPLNHPARRFRVNLSESPP
ncbi:MAG: hypothetical protein ACE5JB_11970 [bacterium]